MQPMTTVKGPIYRRIADQLRDELGGKFATGELLPSESELSARFGVNRHTVRHAIDQLVSDGLVQRQRGVGTRVVAPPIFFRLSRKVAFTDTIEQLGRTASCELLNRKIAAPTDAQRDMLNLKQDEDVITLDLRRAVDTDPVVLSQSVLPIDRYPSLREEYTGDSLHKLLRERHGFEPVLSQNHISARMPTEQEASRLGMPASLPVLVVSGLIQDLATQEPAEIVTMLFRSDAIELDISTES